MERQVVKVKVKFGCIEVKVDLSSIKATEVEALAESQRQQALVPEVQALINVAMDSLYIRVEGFLKLYFPQGPPTLPPPPPSS